MKNMYLLGGVLAVASMTALAAIPPFESLDADANGMISKEEASKSEEVVAGFIAADADKDGSLSPEEYETLL